MQVRGFSLVEVLIASLIIMLGVSGVVSLQSAYMRSDAQVSNRHAALRLAQNKFDDLRQFEAIESASGIIAYNDIADNAGGTITPGQVDVTLGTDGEFHSFYRNWKVENKYFSDSNGDGVADTWMDRSTLLGRGLPLPPFPAQKQVTVTVEWVDSKGNTMAIAVDGNIAPVSLAHSFHAVNESNNVKAQPQVPFTPGSVPDVISYNLGNNQRVEASKPLPDKINQGSNQAVELSSFRYASGGQVSKLLKQEDFLTINCKCKLAGSGNGYTPAMTVLKGDELVDLPGYPEVKDTGVVADNQQPTRCDVCCRDHHDNMNMVASEAYYRLEGGLPHSHYDSVGGGNFTKATQVGDPYIENCRFKRINGFYELSPDWQLVDVIAFEASFLDTQTALDDYLNYTTELIASRISSLPVSSSLASRALQVPPGDYQLIARGIYLDRMTSSHLTTVQAKLAANDPLWPQIVPFYDINLTLLASWHADNPVIATVTSETVETVIDPVNHYYSTYSRGRVTGILDGVTNINVGTYAGNAGITSTLPLSPDEYSRFFSDHIQVRVDSSASAP